jgi:cyclopropane-fatty-acyl-phospholipid synthase
MIEKIIKNKLFKLLNKIEYGELTVKYSDGSIQKFTGKYSGVQANITLNHWKVIPNLMLKGDIGLAEDYRDGIWSSSSIEHLILIGLHNKTVFDKLGNANFVFKQLYKLLYFTRANSIRRSKRNIQAHYDLGNDFYKLWLDRTMTYSSGLFHNDEESLEKAQINKYNRLLNLIHQPNAEILEVGCGWGGFVELASLRGHRVTGITLSKEQYNYAITRTRKLNTNILLEDYRHQDGKYDIVVSIEMLEAVGEKYWDTYFSKLSRLIKPDGKILIQVITIDDNYFDTYRKQADAIRTFIFPGGMLLCESILNKLTIDSGLKIDSIHRFGGDYAKTLRAWANNFNLNSKQIKALGFDDTFIRMWNFYFALCIAGFEHKRINVIQLEISKNVKKD